MKTVKSEKELDIARSEFIKSFNFVVGTLRMNGLSRKVASSFLKRKRLQGYLLLFVMVVNTVRDLISSLNLKSVEELLRFVEIRLGGALGLMKIFKLR